MYKTRHSKTLRILILICVAMFSVPFSALSCNFQVSSVFSGLVYPGLGFQVFIQCLCSIEALGLQIEIKSVAVYSSSQSANGGLGCKNIKHTFDFQIGFNNLLPPSMQSVYLYQAFFIYKNKKDCQRWKGPRPLRPCSLLLEDPGIGASWLAGGAIKYKTKNATYHLQKSFQ